MSDRREQVAKAISEALPAYMLVRGILDPTGKPPYWYPDGEGTLALADAALAVIDAEPTEAEIAAAMEAFAFEYPLRGLCEDMGWHPSFEAAMYAGLTAFLAARKARP